ncbi:MULTISPECIES: hypothetical protein [unclassified Commensalibacter]|uniref:hypothetical protein n=1 Tax=unclassified Commensalibacter TaxID=2630218 RepID=UPI0018DB1BF4|nr:MULTISPECIES: hypothetical protein [unclassified Commensalibacter]MBH9969217.1 hypothetical protein [Commensalibacter sp. M0265]MBH9976572.1 hypothetical protein [Commensalibacter sp. M0266]MBH9992491.1 hypothetical protein [Commensalibacter sp. M0270]MBI0045748.1 hypothetical protein [Commensalibacter sp. M0267]MBI0055417.1 hypothetical protein [Commensalibacter sp. M0268]
MSNVKDFIKNTAEKIENTLTDGKAKLKDAVDHAKQNYETVKNEAKDTLKNIKK